MPLHRLEKRSLSKTACFPLFKTIDSTF